MSGRLDNLQDRMKKRWEVRIDPNSPIPLYFQLKQHILRLLESAQIETGSKLPSEKDFASQSGLSRFTVRQALDELQREGWLEKHQGRGTFAAKPTVPLDVAWKLIGFMEDMTRKGYKVTSFNLWRRL
jgi:GntR family transcriptional regulator